MLIYGLGSKNISFFTVKNKKKIEKNAEINVLY